MIWIVDSSSNKPYIFLNFFKNKRSNEAMIEVEGLVKRFGHITAVDGIRFKVERGEVVGFLCPNGAGKTTTMRVLTCYLPADEGRCKVAGFDVLTDSVEVRKRIGYLPEDTPLYSDMSVEGFLKYIAEVREIYGEEQKRRINKMIEICGLEPVLKMDISELSKGYRQRVGLAQAMLHDPDILILDEPTTGLDPNQIIEIRSLIKELGKEKTVILSTHILPEVEATCGRVIIIHRGKLVAEGTLEEVSKLASGANIHRIKIRGDKAKIEDKLKELDGVESIQLKAEDDGLYQYQIFVQPGKDLGEEIFKLCVQNGFILSELYRERKTLEDVFTELTGREGV